MLWHISLHLRHRQDLPTGGPGVGFDLEHAFDDVAEVFRVDFAQRWVLAPNDPFIELVHALSSEWRFEHYCFV